MTRRAGKRPAKPRRPALAGNAPAGNALPILGILAAAAILRIAVPPLLNLASAAIGVGVTAGLLLGLPISALGLRLLNRRYQAHRARRAAAQMARWLDRPEWEYAAIRETWPWTRPQRPETVTVISARERLVEGFPVTAGEIVWTRNGLGAAVTRYSGRGVYILVQLPQQLRSMSVRAYRKRRNGRREDAFRRRFSSRGVDRHRLADPEFRDAHVRGDVPSWTVIERELWAVVALDKPVTPPAIDSAVQRTLRVVRLLGLGPGAAAPTLAGSAVIPPRSIRAALPRSIQTPHLGRSRHRHLGRSGRP